MKEIEMEGKTVTIAVENGLEKLGLRRDQVEVEVLQEGSAGFLGIGGKSALVRLREKNWDPAAALKSRPAAKTPKRQAASPRKTDEPPRADIDTDKACGATRDILAEILRLAEIKTPQIKCAWDSEQGRVRAEVDTPDAALLIGKGGRTIEALQFLVTVIVGRKIGNPAAIQIEAQGYWKKIEGKILAEAESAVEDVVRTGKSHRFEPLEASLRRLIHRRLAGHPDVVTASEGEGPWRKVVIKPRPKS